MKHETEPTIASGPTGGGLLNKEQLAAFLGVTERTVENFHKRGLPHYRLGSRRCRYDLASVRAWLDRSCRIVRVN